MRLQGRLVTVFFLMVLLLLVPSVLAILSLSTLRDMAVEGREQHAAAALALGQFETGLSDLDRLQRSYLVTGDPVLLQGTRGALARLREAIPPLRESAYLDHGPGLEQVVDGLAAANARIETLVLEGRPSEADQVFGGMGPLMEEARRRLADLAVAIDEQAEGDFLRAEAIISSSRGTVLLLLLVSGILALLVAIWTVRSLATPARKLAGAMAEVTGGTLEAPDDLPYDQKDEIGELCRSFRTMTHRLAELDRMKAEFLGVAGHELKTPITVIAAYSELIEEEMPGELTEQQQGILTGIVDQTRTLTRLVNRLMDISRLESGSLHMEMEPVHLEDLVTGVVRSFEVMAAKKGVSILSEIDPSAPESVVLDMDLIRNEVLGNLVSNALKFVPADGEIRIRVRGEGNEVVFQVSDDGPGIPPEHRPHIFEKHYQVERSRKVGSGLGLAIAREVVELHGGSVALLDTASPGAVFEVRVPISPPA
jgi:signal transduction histidine kinase